jgi:hypothetical protein
MEKVAWRSYQIKELKGYLTFYIDVMGWAKRKDGLTNQYIHLLHAVQNVEDNKCKIIDSIIDNAPGLKDYMLIHSVFDINDNDCSDWFIIYMIDKLNYEPVIIKQDIPNEIMEKLKIFDPQGIDYFVDDVMLSYGMWKRDKNQRLLDPIHISCWNNIKEECIDMEPILGSYEEMETPF